MVRPKGEMISPKGQIEQATTSPPESRDRVGQISSSVVADEGALHCSGLDTVLQYWGLSHWVPSISLVLETCPLVSGMGMMLDAAPLAS